MRTHHLGVVGSVTQRSPKSRRGILPFLVQILGFFVRPLRITCRTRSRIPSTAQVRSVNPDKRTEIARSCPPAKKKPRHEPGRRGVEKLTDNYMR
jgi:hypothetical protein